MSKRLHSDTELLTLACSNLLKLKGWMGRGIYINFVRSALVSDLQGLARADGIARILIERGLVETRQIEDVPTCSHCGQALPDAPEAYTEYRLTDAGACRGWSGEVTHA